MAADKTHEIMMELFRTLKEAIKENTATIKDLVDGTKTLHNYLQSGPAHDVIKQAINGHDASSTKKLEDLNECTESIETKSDSILNAISNLTTKVKVMIATVVGAFAVLTIAYFVINIYVDNKIERKIEQLKPYDEHDSLKDQIEDLRKEIRRLHEGDLNDADSDT